MKFIQKYQPKNIDEYFGNQNVVVKLVEFVTDYDGGGFILVGPPGCGKTSMVYTIANEFNFDIIEINASDKRNTKELKRLETACFYQSYDNKNLILLDEADHLRSNKQLKKIIKHSKTPIIMTANYYKKVPSSIKRSIQKEVINFPSTKNLAKLYDRVVKEEDISPNDEKEDICEKCQTYRQLLMYLENDMYLEDLKEKEYLGEMNQLDEVKRILHGDLDKNEKLGVKPYSFLYWLEANGLYNEALHIDEMLSIGMETWGVWDMIKSYIKHCRKDGYIKYPRWRKRKKKDKDDEPKVKKIKKKRKVQKKNKKEKTNLSNWF